MTPGDSIVPECTVKLFLKYLCIVETFKIVSI